MPLMLYEIFMLRSLSAICWNDDHKELPIAAQLILKRLYFNRKESSKRLPIQNVGGKNVTTPHRIENSLSKLCFVAQTNIQRERTNENGTNTDIRGKKRRTHTISKWNRTIICFFLRFCFLEYNLCTTRLNFTQFLSLDKKSLSRCKRKESLSSPLLLVAQRNAVWNFRWQKKIRRFFTWFYVDVSFPLCTSCFSSWKKRIAHTVTLDVCVVVVVVAMFILLSQICFTEFTMLTATHW